MQIAKFGDKGISLTPHTAMEENFIYYLSELIEGKEAKFLSDLAARHKFLAQDSLPLKEVLES